MTNEEWYDAEVSPKLLELATACHARGLSFLANVEYAEGDRAETRLFTEDAGLEMQLLARLSDTAPNIDGFIIQVLRYLEQEGIDASGSFVLSRYVK